jgi:hypothetical protein
MRSILKKLTVLSLCMISHSILADDNKRFVIFNYNLQSINPSLTNQQCEELFKSPIFYRIENDKVIYETKSGYTASNYQRTNVAFIDKHNYLFTGTSTYAFDWNGKKQTATEESAFVLRKKEKMIRGSFIIKGFCKGNLIGVEETNNKWPIKS